MLSVAGRPPRGAGGAQVGPFQVTAAEPASGEQDAPVGGSIRVALSAQVDAASVTPESVILSGPRGRVSARCEARGATVVVMPERPLGPRQSYRVSVQAGLRAVDGRTLAAGLEWRFQTEDGLFSDAEEVVRAVGPGADIREHEVVVAGDGRALATWIESRRLPGSAPRVRAAVMASFFASGRGWEEPQQIGDGDEASGLSVTMDEQGRAIVRWCLPPGTMVTHFSPGSGWNHAEAVQGPRQGRGAGHPHAETTADQGESDRAEMVDLRRAVSAWGAARAFVRSGPGGGLFVVRCKNDGLTGGSWTRPLRLDVEGSQVIEAALGIDAEGNVLALWSAREAGQETPRVYGRRWSEVGVLAPVEQLGRPDGASEGAPALALDSAGNALAIWRRGTAAGGQVAVTRYQPRFANWLPGRARTLSQLGDAQGAPRVCTDAEGRGVVSWVRREGAERALVISRFT